MGPEPEKNEVYIPGKQPKVVVVEDIPTLRLNSLLKDQWYPHHKGGCHILSKGNACLCHYCLIDELTSRAIKEE